jgi:hypothetical protein
VSTISPISAPAARIFETISRLRQKRGFHPFGVGFHANLVPTAGGRIGAEALERETEGVVRLSRSLGLPEWLPDPCGVALRLPDAYGEGLHQDMLFASSGLPPFARHALLPSRGFADAPHSTLLPYRVGGRLTLFSVRVVGVTRPGPKLAELRERARAEINLELGAAGLFGSWRPLATIMLGERLPAEETELLDFDPGNTGGGLQLAGFLNRLRVPSYAGSQAGRHSEVA